MKREKELPEVVKHLLLSGNLDPKTREVLKENLKTIILNWPDELITVNDIIKELWWQFKFIPVSRAKVVEYIHTLRCNGYISYGDYVTIGDKTIFSYRILKHK